MAARRFEHKISNTIVRRFEHITSDARITALNYLQIVFALNFGDFVGIADVVTSQFQLKEPHVEIADVQGFKFVKFSVLFRKSF